MKLGWGYPLNSRKAHVFASGRSLCGRWGYFGGTNTITEAPGARGPDDCAECHRKLVAHWSVSPRALFYLGTHHPAWLARPAFAHVPLFISRRTFGKTLPRALGTWALDSGGFTELNLFGRWETSPAAYVAEVRRLRDGVGGLAWAAPQDWMCEPVVLEKTGLTVEEHQRRTVRNFVEIRALAPELPIIPVLQGWSLYDYWRCEEMYSRAGVRLQDEPIVGVGTVCRRQGTTVAGMIMSTLADRGLRLHGFGFKVRGLIASAAHLESADSLAWSYQARRRPPMPGHDKPGPGRRTGHINCANCPDYALEWRDDVLAQMSMRRAA